MVDVGNSSRWQHLAASTLRLSDQDTPVTRESFFSSLDGIQHAEKSLMKAIGWAVNFDALRETMKSYPGAGPMIGKYDIITKALRTPLGQSPYSRIQLSQPAYYGTLIALLLHRRSEAVEWARMASDLSRTANLDLPPRDNRNAWWVLDERNPISNPINSVTPAQSIYQAIRFAASIPETASRMKSRLLKSHHVGVLAEYQSGTLYLFNALGGPAAASKASSPSADTSWARETIFPSWPKL
jgi:hypothetical protein